MLQIIGAVVIIVPIPSYKPFSFSLYQVKAKVNVTYNTVFLAKKREHYFCTKFHKEIENLIWEFNDLYRLYINFACRIAKKLRQKHLVWQNREIYGSLATIKQVKCMNAVKYSSEACDIIMLAAVTLCF